MEYAKDMILELQYEDKPEEKKASGSVITRHKWVTLMVALLILLTAIDIVLMVQFYEVLKEL